MLYPLTFRPIFKDKIWGGDKIHSVLGKEYPGLPNCGETWEISAVEGNVSVVSTGPLAGKDLRNLMEEYGAALLGGRILAKYGKNFPLLVKFISAADDLSIQVHPGDEMAQRYHGSYGKTEMWYVLDADPGARLISGFVRPVTREEYLEYFESGRLEQLLLSVPVEKGDCFFLPPGRVHSIGRGILLAEIQQSSDVTYRIYDFDRTDASGHRRELHVEQALRAMDFSASGDPKTHYRQTDAGAVALVECPYFGTDLLKTGGRFARDYSDAGSFVMLTCVEGNGKIVTRGGETTIAKGQCVLLPAEVADDVEIVPQEYIELLETWAK